jgi:flagellar export protein FliJ
MPFDFRMERIMKIAESQQKSLKSQYQELYDRLESIAGQLIRLLDEKKQIQKKLESSMKQPTSVESMKLQLNDIDYADKMIEKQTRIYQELTTYLEKFRIVLREKSVEVKKFEKIKSKQKVIYHHDQLRKEMKQMDEIAALRPVSGQG